MLTDGTVLLAILKC